MKTNIYCTFHY